eukprot:3677845-Pleurochrysis_carterae.AAC.1
MDVDRAAVRRCVQKNGAELGRCLARPMRAEKRMRLTFDLGLTECGIAGEGVVAEEFIKMR